MAPRKKQIPFNDIKGLKTLQNEDWTHEEMAKYYSKIFEEKVSRRTIERRLKELDEK